MVVPHGSVFLRASLFIYCIFARLSLSLVLITMPPRRNAPILADSNLPESLLPEMRLQFSKMNETLTSELQKLRSEFNAALSEKNTIINKLETEVASLKTRVDVLEEKIDESNAYSRRDSLVFSGDEVPPVPHGDNPDDTNQVIIDLVRKLNIDIRSSDISISHRLGKPPRDPASPDKRKIIVRFCRRDLKSNILQACRIKKPKFFANESLTPTRNTIMFALRKIRREKSDLIKGIFTTNGRVFLSVKPESDSDRTVKIPMNTKDQLSKFCTENVGKSLDEYDIYWP